MGIVADMMADELKNLEAAGEIETAGKLKIWRENRPGLYLVKIWRGKAKRHKGYYSFKTEGAREQYICREIDGERLSAEARERYKADEAANLAKYLETIQVGTLLHYSWGYDQTNCEFFQVTERRGRMVTIRAIDGEAVPSSGASDMSCRMRPIRDAFCEGRQAETHSKRIGPYGISMSFGSARPCGDGDTFYCSWYA